VVGPSPVGRELSSSGRNGVDKQLPLDQAREFGVFEREKITLSIGDQIRFTKNTLTGPVLLLASALMQLRCVTRNISVSVQ
jgi:hypothetical protein